MACRYNRRMVDSVASQRATPAEEHRVRQHAQVCPSCARALAEAEAYASLLRCINEPEAPDEAFTRATMSRIRHAGVQPTRWPGLLGRVSVPTLGGVALAAAACVALVLAAPGGLRLPSGSGSSSSAVESSPVVVAVAPAEALHGLRSLEARSNVDDTSDPFADGAVMDLSRAGAGHYMLTGLGL